MLKVLQQVVLRLLGLDGDSGWEARSFWMDWSLVAARVGLTLVRT